jgi:hypothetical protein
MATVKRAMTGVDVVIQSLGVSAGPEIILKPTRLFSTATRLLVTAMEETQIKRLICVAGFGAGDSRGHGGFLYSAAFRLLIVALFVIGHDACHQSYTSSRFLNHVVGRIAFLPALHSFSLWDREHNHRHHRTRRGLDELGRRREITLAHDLSDAGDVPDRRIIDALELGSYCRRAYDSPVQHARHSEVVHVSEFAPPPLKACP